MFKVGKWTRPGNATFIPHIPLSFQLKSVPLMGATFISHLDDLEVAGRIGIPTYGFSGESLA